MEELIKEILKPIEEKMDKFLKSQRKISVKFLRTMAIGTYLNSEVIKYYWVMNIMRDLIKC